MRILFYRVVFISILFNSYFVYCQTRNSFFERITIKDGLSQSTVNSIIQDKEGFLWFATYDGINRYDGYNFKIFRNISNDENSLSYNGTENLYLDKSGYIWVVNNGKEGLDRFDPKTEKFTKFKYSATDSASISSNEINCVFEDKKGNIWIATNNALNLLLTKSGKGKIIYTFKRFYYPFSKNSGGIKIFENSYGNLLLISDNLYFFDRNINKFIKSNLLGENVVVTSVQEDKNNNLWISTNGLGIMKFAYDKKTKNYKREEINHINVAPDDRNYLIIDKKDRKWVATLNGLFLIDEAKNQIIQYLYDKNNINSISENSLKSLYIDSSGVLWIGTSGQGLCKLGLNDKQFYHYKTNNKNGKSIAGNVISSIHSKIEGELWVGFDLGGGIDRLIFNNFEIQQIEHYKLGSKGLGETNINNIISLVQRKNGEIWAGSAGGFITRIKPGKAGENGQAIIKTFNHEKWTFSLFEDSNGILWGGTWGHGLWRFDEKSENFTFFKHSEGNSTTICDEIVWSLYEDNNGNLWIGGHGGGFSILSVQEKYKVNPAFFSYKYNKTDLSSLSNNTGHTFCQDQKGNMWIGTSGGLNKVKSQSGNFKEIEKIRLDFTTYHKKDGLPGETVVGILEDNNGNLWLSTSNGISKFNLENGTFTNFDEKDGLQGNEFWHNSYFKDLSGKMYFGGNNGFNSFYPDSIKLNQILPKIVFTSLKIFNQEVEIGKKVNGYVVLNQSINNSPEIVLSHKNDAFTIEFAALHFVKPGRNNYAYKLDGFDEEWNYVGNKHEATYTNLDPGEYTFFVIASNNDGVWNKKGSSIKIIVLPPWWMTWWFRVIAFVLTVIMLIGFYLLRVDILKKQKKFLEQTVKERTLEIEEKNRILSIQKADLYEANVLLEEKQQEIEEQNETLLDQALKLNETNSIMEERQMQIEEQTEELYASNEKLLVANSTKDKFFSIIAHDIKSPFSSILGLIGLLNKKFDAMTDSRKKEIMESMNESGKKLYKLIDNLLLWANSQTGNIQFEPKELDLNEIIKENLILFENLLVEKKLEVQQRIDSQISIFADKNMIDTVIRNLINNAIKFTQTGYIKIEAFQDNLKTIVSITDTGVGIDSDKLNKLFDVVGSKSTLGTQGEAGSGLGLLLCKEFIEKHGGTITAQSEPGKGSVFSFIVPLKKADK
jgi:signal transduction histidine kinase/ligand-binding sensor domain-containing protein